MKKGLTELVFILDKSGSMGGLETDTIGGCNTMLKKQQTVDGKCLITTVLFDNNYELLHDRIDIKAINPITEKEYFIGGSTALLGSTHISEGIASYIENLKSKEGMIREVLQFERDVKCELSTIDID